MLCSLPVFAESRTIRLAAAEWCPYTCSTMTNKGVVTEYVSKLLAKNNVQLEVVFLPWNRAISQAESGKLDGLLTAVHAEAPGLVFTKVATADYRSCIMSTIETNKMLSQESLNTVIVGYTENYGYGKKIDALLAQLNEEMIVKISGNNTTSRLIKMNKINRIQYFVEEELVTAYEANNLNINVTSHICGEKNPFYLAINPESENKLQLINLLDDEIANSRELLDSILKSHSLSTN